MKRTKTGLLAFIVVFSTILIIVSIFTLNGSLTTVQSENASTNSSKSSSRLASPSKSTVLEYNGYPSLRDYIISRGKYKISISILEKELKRSLSLEDKEEINKLVAEKIGYSVGYEEFGPKNEYFDSKEYLTLKEYLIGEKVFKINIDVLEKEFKRELTPYDWWNILQLIAEDSRYSYGFGNYGIDLSAPPNPYTPKDAKPHTYYNKYFHITYPAQILKSDSHHLTFSARDVVLLKNFDPTFSKDESKCLFAINHYSYEAFSECSLAICAKLKSDTSDRIVPEDILFTDYEISLYGNKGFQQYRPVTLNNQTFTYIVFDENEYLCFVKNNIVFTVSLSWSHSIFRDPAEHEAYYAQQDEITQKWNQQMIEMLNSIQFK